LGVYLITTIAPELPSSLRAGLVGVAVNLLSAPLWAAGFVLRSMSVSYVVVCFINLKPGTRCLLSKKKFLPLLRVRGVAPEKSAGHVSCRSLANFAAQPTPTHKFSTGLLYICRCTSVAYLPTVEQLPLAKSSQASVVYTNKDDDHQSSFLLCHVCLIVENLRSIVQQFKTINLPPRKNSLQPADSFILYN
jgi:hypothetical protein